MAAFTRVFAVVAAAVVLGWAGLSSQSLAVETTTGADAYREYCVGCHGRAGRGDGPVASTLRTPVPDLTTIANRHSGSFPRAAVMAASRNVDRPVAAHGTGEMPVWGHVFQTVAGDRARVDRLLESLVSYVETLQQPMLATPAAGRALYDVYCARCHGPAGGGGIGPDLTGYALRNGGVFPSVRLAQIIDGRGVAAHGPRSMPVWGDVFKAVPGDRSPRAAATRVDAITTYLQSIQRQLGE